MTSRFSRFGTLGGRLLAVYVTVIFATLLALFVVLETSRYRQDHRDLIAQIDEIATIQAASLANAVWQIDHAQIDRIMTSLAKVPNVLGARLVDEKGVQIGKVGDPDGVPARGDYRVERDLTVPSQGGLANVGKLTVIATSGGIDKELRQRLLLDGVVFAVVLGAIVAATVLATRLVIGRPLERLRGAIERSREEQVANPIEWTGANELGRVVEAYNALQADRAAAERKLRDHQDALEKLVAARTEEATQKANVLRTVLDSMPGGLMAVDRNFTVQIVNAAFIRYYGLPDDRIRAGVPLTDILRVRAVRGDYGEGDVERLVADRLATYGGDVQRYVDRLPGGRIVEVVRTPTGDGGLVLLADDVTERIKAEEALAREKIILETTLENMAQGISFVDRELNLVAFNSKFIELLDFPPDIMKPGVSLERAFRFNAERGEYGPGDAEEQVRERMALAAKMQPHHLQRTRPSGIILDIRGRPAGSMGFVTTYTNVTDQVRAENELRDKLGELERFNRLAIDRELRMIELKRQINDLQKAMGREAEYVVVD